MRSIANALAAVVAFIVQRPLNPLRDMQACKTRLFGHSRALWSISQSLMILSLEFLVEQETVLSRKKVQKQSRWQRLIAGLLCACLFVWSVLPTAAHTPKFLETVQDHLQMIEDHGHSHGLEIDLLWAMHGHQHDLADHDHNTAFLMKSGPKSDFVFDHSSWGIPASDASSILTFPPERPPRS